MTNGVCSQNTNTQHTWAICTASFEQIYSSSLNLIYRECGTLTAKPMVIMAMFAGMLVECLVYASPETHDWISIWHRIVRQLTPLGVATFYDYYDDDRCHFQWPPCSFVVYPLWLAFKCPHGSICWCVLWLFMAASHDLRLCSSII